MSVCTSVRNKNPSASQNRSYWLLSLSTIKSINYWAYWPIYLSAIWPAFATSKPFRLVWLNRLSHIWHLEPMCIFVTNSLCPIWHFFLEKKWIAIDYLMIRNQEKITIQSIKFSNFTFFYFPGKYLNRLRILNRFISARLISAAETSAIYWYWYCLNTKRSLC